MVCHIICTECSEDIGAINPAFEAVKNAYFDKLLREHGNIDVERVDFKGDILPGLAFIFDALGIKNQCCRVHILGVTDFDF